MPKSLMRLSRPTLTASLQASQMATTHSLVRDYCPTFWRVTFVWHINFKINTLGGGGDPQVKEA